MLLVGANKFVSLPFVVLQKVVPQDRLSHLLHQTMIESQIMNRQQLPSQNLLGFDEMVQVRAGVVPAGHAIASRVDGPIG